MSAPAGRKPSPTARSPSGPFLDPLTMFEDVFKDMPPNLVRAARGAARTAQSRPGEASAAPPSVAQEG